MTKKNILEIIKENNQNEDIKWTVTKNTKNLIVITNDYDESVKFEIKLNYGESGKDIKVVDVNGWKHEAGYFIQGHEFWADFENEEVGISMAVKRVVKFFYYYY